MKKALAMALGAMLVAGAAAPAFAASQIDFKGLYRIYQLNLYNQDFAKDKYDPEYSNDSFFVNRLQMDFTFNATDEVAVYWRLRGPNSQRWGTNGGVMITGASGQNSGNQAVATRWLYGEVKQDWGTVSVGRLADGFVDIGLADLGHSLTYVDGDGAWGYGSPFDLDNPYDGIRWANRWDNGFQLVAQFTRAATGQRNTTVEFENDDLFILEPAYLWDGGGATLALIYNRNHLNPLDLEYTNGVPYPSDADAPALKAFFVNPAISHNFGDFTVNFEGKAGWGSIEDPDWDDKVKVKGYAFYLDFDYNYGPGNVTLAGWWASGSKSDPTDVTAPDGEDFKGAVDFGVFAPFIVAYGDDYHNGWNGGAGGNAIKVANEVNSFEANYNANHWAIALMGAHAFTDDVTLQYGLGYLSLNKINEFKTDNTGNAYSTQKAKKDIGFEGDLGLKVQLLDNLNFTTSFGYLVAGGALKDENGDKENAYSWLNTLTFSF